MLHAKNYYSGPMFHVVIQKITLVHFFETRCIVLSRLWGCSQDEPQSAWLCTEMIVRRRQPSLFIVHSLSYVMPSLPHTCASFANISNNWPKPLSSVRRNYIRLRPEASTHFIHWGGILPLSILTLSLLSRPLSLPPPFNPARETGWALNVTLC